MALYSTLSQVQIVILFTQGRMKGFKTHVLSKLPGVEVPFQVFLNISYTEL
jgi:hypothetical protein